MDEKQEAIEAIKKKLIGKRLTYSEIHSIMDEIAHDRLGSILTTYFAAASFKEGFSEEELYSFTRAMVETGDSLKFSGVVADKHSMGGVPGTRTSMIIVPIVAAAGFYIPKNSSRAITTPAGTADTMEVFCPVTFTHYQVQQMVEKVGGCIVWGGGLGLAPADDVMISVEEPLGFESFDKMIVSIMAKKVAAGATHVIFDVPVGPTMKIHHLSEAQVIEKKLHFLADKFSMHIVVDINRMSENAGRGIGPILEARDVLQVLEQSSDRSIPLEKKALTLAAKLLNLCFSSISNETRKYDGEKMAQQILSSGNALKKMREIIQAQGGNSDISSSDLLPGKEQHEIRAARSGEILSIDNQKISTIGRILGCPQDKAAGVFLHKKRGSVVEQGDILCSLYSSDAWRLKEAISTTFYMPIYTISS